MNLWHVTLSSDDRHPLFAGETERRAGLRAIARAAGALLVLFAVIDEHLHLILLCERALAGRIARAVALSIRPLLASPLQSARIRPATGPRHMEKLLRYLLQQPEHHGLPVPPAIWTGSCFPDLIGARRLDGLTLRIAEALPRFRLRMAYELVGLPAEPLTPCADEELRAAGAESLVRTATSALAVGPALTGRTPEVVRARRTVCHLARQAGIAAAEVRHALQVTRQGMAHLAASTPEPMLMRCVRQHLSLEHAVRRQLFESRGLQHGAALCR